MAKTLGDNLNVVCRMEHHPEWLLATTESGSLRLTDEQRGLSYEVVSKYAGCATGLTSDSSVELELRRKLSDERAKRLGYDKARPAFDGLP